VPETITYYCQYCIGKLYNKRFCWFGMLERIQPTKEETDKCQMPFGTKNCPNCGQEMEWPEVEAKPWYRSDGQPMLTAAYPKKQFLKEI